MLISQLIYQLEKLQQRHGDLDVMFQNDNGEAWEIMLAGHHTVSDDEYPENWNLPEGFEFIKLTN